ncbi:MAG: DUF3488 and transglutaminase-like domain-containing protein [Bacteroidales bacterium]|nr:DUF3488 and transglutaminase-like domain-containing protein [Bacteroidales bacterium]
MPTYYRFQLSTYLTLGLACVCLGYAEWDFLPEVTIFTAVVILLLGLSFWAEGQFALSIPQANRLGIVIGLLAALWVGWQVIRPTGGLVYSLPWPTSLLPYLGPLLMVLIPAKLFRPKQVDDWWALQGIGLAAVGLAAAMSDQGVLGALLTLYVLVGVWNLVQFCYLRASGAIVEPCDADRNGTPPRTVVVHVGQPMREARLLRRSLIWVGIAAGVALPLFFLTPRAHNERWKFGTVMMETGFAASQMVDLNRTGELHENPEIAFTVKAHYPDGSPKLNLDPETYWRGVGYRAYDNGRWSQSGSMGLTLFTSRSLARWMESALPPDFGPGQYILDYEPQSLDQPVLAEPIFWSGRQPSPIMTLATGKPWYQSPDGHFSYSPASDGKIYPYRQYCPPAATPALSPPNEMLSADVRLRIDGPPIGWDALQSQITTMALPKLSAWTGTVLQQLVDAGRLPAAVLTRRRMEPRTLRKVIAPEDYSVVAQAFRDFFAEGSRFQYDVKLRVENRAIDPIEDFVLNTRSGHCERFATALTLCLRTLGIPAVFVLGFRGCEQSQPGFYVVRQEHAHAWVEVLIPGPVAGTELAAVQQPPPPDRVWHWLTLDPTPSTSATVQENPVPADWLQNIQQSWTTAFSDLIIEYNGKRREQILLAVQTHLREYGRWYLLLLLVLAIGGRGFRGLIRTRQQRSTRPVSRTVPWYEEYRHLLMAAGYGIPPAQTPLEHAHVLQELWQSSPATQDIAAWPARLVTLFYQVRYGQYTLTPEEEAEIAQKIFTLRQRLHTIKRESL